MLKTISLLQKALETSYYMDTIETEDTSFTLQIDLIDQYVKDMNKILEEH